MIKKNTSKIDEYIQPFTMNEIRDDVGQDIVESVTDWFLSTVATVEKDPDFRKKVEKNLKKIRSENFDPILLEIEHALYVAMLDLSINVALSEVGNLRHKISETKKNLDNAENILKKSPVRKIAHEGALARKELYEEIELRFLNDWCIRENQTMTRSDFAKRWMRRNPDVKISKGSLLRYIRELGEK